MRTSVQFRIFIQLISSKRLPGFLYQTEIKGEQSKEAERQRERVCECERWLMAAIASIVNGQLENTSVEINKIIGICKCEIN
jgi:hypothetical protein